ncbi:MAG: type II toxin-antitoxin system HicB family antitoxin [Hormoscilla sp. GM102CHS1]|nr:type II toxin-antitoxin system HicB family antitoxin [Hormoscilla sp. GM102CHS1]
MKLRNYITAKISRGEQQGYVAECLEINVVTQGSNLDEIVSNLQEAVALYLEDEDPTELGFVAQPTVLVTFEFQPEYA